MSDLILLLVLAACVLAVIGGLTYFGLRAYRLVRTGMRASRNTGAQARVLSDKAAAVQAKAAALAESGGGLSENAGSLQTALARLMVLVSAITEARAPWQAFTRILRK
jgi:hypothetical protein